MDNYTRRQIEKINRIYANQDRLNNEEAIKAVEEFERQERERERREREKERLRIEKEQKEQREREKREREQREREQREREKREREQREREQREMEKERLRIEKEQREMEKERLRIEKEQREREQREREQRERERVRIEKLRIEIPREHIILLLEAIELVEHLQDRRIHIRQLHDMLDYLRIKQKILKIPFFAHYNNLANYVGDSNMLRAWFFNYRDENIYLVKNYILPEDEIVGKINIEFRPNTFYMKQLKKYEPGTNLRFFGRLEIINLKTKKIIILPDVNVYSHDGTFSFNDKILNLEKDLEINTSKLEEEYLYYIKFTPTRIDMPKHDRLESYPIFKGFYSIKVIANIGVILDDEPQNDSMPIQREILQVLDSLKQSLPKKGGNYSQKQKKSITKKYKIHKINKLKKLKKIKTKKQINVK